MAQTSGFFEAEWDSELYNEETQSLGDWDRKYLAEEFARYFQYFVSNGVMNEPENQLKVTAGEGMKVIVSSGFAFINGYWFYNSEQLELAVPLNETPSSRYDSIRVRWNAGTRSVDCIYIADDIINVRNDAYYDLQLAQVKVDASASVITDAVITDTRSNDELCGLINLVKAEDIGNLEDLQTEDKSNIVDAINSLVSLQNEIIVSHRTFNFSPERIYTYADSRITSESLADVYFDSDTFETAQRANVSVETYNGFLTLTASRNPSGNIAGTIKVRVV